MSLPDLPESFFPRWVSELNAIGVNPFYVAQVGFSETQMRPNSRNGSGLIGFVPSTLARLGWQGTPDEFGQLSAEEQLPYVVAYYRPYAKWATSPGMTYVINFTPGLLAEAAAGGSDYVIAGENGPRASIYNSNRILDRNGDGLITVGDLEQHLSIMDQGARWNEVVAALSRAGAVGAKAVPWLALGLTAATVGWYLYYTQSGRSLRKKVFGG